MITLTEPNGDKVYIHVNDLAWRKPLPGESHADTVKTTIITTLGKFFVRETPERVKQLLGD